MSLIEAVRNNDANRVMQLLATDEVDVCETDAGGWTPLIYASYFGRKDIVELLLNYDNSSGHIYWQCDNGGTALMWASWNGYKEIVEILLNHNNSPEHINQQSARKITALMVASCYGYKEITKILLKYDNSQKHIDRQDNWGNTALMEASKNGYKEIVELLLANGVSIDILNNKDKSAADLARTEEIRELLLNWEPKGIIRAKGGQY